MDRNGYWGLLLLGGGLLLGALTGPYKGNGNSSPRYGRSRNDRIPPSYKQSVAICATAFVIEALLTFVGIAFFDTLSPRARRIVFDTGLVVVGIGFVVSLVVLGIHEHLENAGSGSQRERNTLRKENCGNMRICCITESQRKKPG